MLLRQSIEHTGTNVGMTGDLSRKDDPILKLQRILAEEDQNAQAAPSAAPAPSTDPLARLEAFFATPDAELRPAHLSTNKAAAGRDPLEMLEALMPAEPREAGAVATADARDPLLRLQEILEQTDEAGAPAQGDAPAAQTAPPEKPRLDASAPSPPLTPRFETAEEPKFKPLPREEPDAVAAAAKQAFRQSQRELGEKAELDDIIRHACKKLDADGQTILLQIQLKAMLRQI